MQNNINISPVSRPRDCSGLIQIDRSKPFVLGQYADHYKGSLETQAVVIKSFRGVPFDDDDRDRFRNMVLSRAAPWYQASHVNIVPLWGITYDIPHLISLVTPFHEHGNVMAYLKESPHSDALTLELIRGVAAGLSYLHSLNIVHTDIRGCNVLVDDEGRPRLTDIGLAPILQTSNFTTANVAGPCRWQSPEVIQYDEPEGDGSQFTLKSDVYSFSMLLIELLTGEKPFSHRNLDTTVIFDVINARRPLRPATSALASNLWPLIETCWSQYPTARPTMSAVRVALSNMHTASNGETGLGHDQQ